MSQERAYIALGSNLADPLKQVNDAVAEIDQLSNCRVEACSPWYRTAPIGPGPQDDYINGVVAIHTSLSPASLLQALQGIENAHGRRRRQRWGPRTLDLDILLYGDLIHNSENLQIPHSRLAERAFVLYPLADLAPDLIIPGGISVMHLLENVSPEGIVRL